jgi:RimJ/RimL family protein N-acetyltransferase
VRYRLVTDLPAIALASRDAETLHWMLDRPMDAIALETSLDRVADAFRSGASAPMVVADAVTDEPVGLINLQFRSDDVATIAYSVFPDRRGRGIAGRSLELVARWATEELKVRELLLEIDEANRSSIRVAEKCGFVPLGDSLEAEDGKAVYFLPRD